MGCVSGDIDCSDVERPQHTVRLDRGFWMGRTEVTVGAYKKFAQETESSLPAALKHNAGWKEEDHPITRVNWRDAVQFCGWSGGRLPTEAEWEYAARAGKEDLTFPWGSDPDRDEANYGGAGGRDKWRHTAPVGSFPANDYGLFDMAGKVWEWVADWRQPTYYAGSPAMNPRGPSSGDYRVMRGGSFYSDAGSLRVSYRGTGDPEVGLFYSGFRCARDESP